jgi:hypothetical protein
MLSLSKCRYRLDWDVYRGIDLIPCRHGELGGWSGDAFYALTGNELVHAALLAIDGVRACGTALVFQPELLDPVAQLMGAERIVSLES